MKTKKPTKEEFTIISLPNFSRSEMYRFKEAWDKQKNKKQTIILVNDEVQVYHFKNGKITNNLPGVKFVKNIKKRSYLWGLFKTR